MPRIVISFTQVDKAKTLMDYLDAYSWLLESPPVLEDSPDDQMRKDIDEMAKKISELESSLEIVRLHTSYRTADDD